MNRHGYFAVQHHQSVPLSPRLLAAIDHMQLGCRMMLAHQDASQILLTQFATPRLCFPNGRGLIIGHLFERATSARIVEPGGNMDGPVESFVQRHWGGYVALRSTRDGAEAWRDPSGAMPCYYLGIDGAQIYTSAPAILFGLGLLAADIDWEMLGQGLIYRDIKPTRTLLRRVEELLPGAARSIHASETHTRCIWSPWRFIDTCPDPTFCDAVAAVGEAVTSSVAAWARCFERPMLEISGGLDSAIVAAIASKHASSTAITFAPIAGDPDETPYAAAIAQAIGVDLTIVAPAIGEIDVARSNAAGLPRPYARCFSQDFDRSALGHAKRTNADAIFSGGGGDNVFCYLQSLSPLIDRFHAGGSKSGLIDTINDLADLGNTNVWSIALRTLRRLMRGSKAPWYIDTRLLHTDWVQTASLPDEHPWVQVPDKAPPGKVAHVAALIAFQNHLEGHGRSAWAPIVSPLLAQPIMETCLAVPSWLWCSGGNNRAVARAAFKDLLPTPVLARRSKGAFDSLAAQLLEANRPRVTELLMDGSLAAEGIVDRDAVLRAIGTADPSLTVRLWQLVDTEAWARSWQPMELWAKPPSLQPNA